MNAQMRDQIANAVAAAGYPIHHMDSGAGHDAMIVAPHIPSAMLFLRSPEGISHHPDEHVDDADADTGARVLLRVIENFQRRDEAEQPK